MAYYAPHFGNAFAGYYPGDEQFPADEEEFSEEPCKNLTLSDPFSANHFRSALF